MSGQEIMAAQAGGSIPSMSMMPSPMSGATGFSGGNLLSGDMSPAMSGPGPMSMSGFGGQGLLGRDIPNMPNFNQDGYSGMNSLPPTMTGTNTGGPQPSPRAATPRPNFDFKNPLGQFALGMLQHNLMQQPQMPQYPMHNMGMGRTNPMMPGPNMYQARPLGFRYG